MSASSQASDFIRRMETDDDIQKSVQQEGMVQVAQKNGFDLSAEDITQAIKEREAAAFPDREAKGDCCGNPSTSSA